MAIWDRTHGTVQGAYLTAGATRLYVRRARGDKPGWLLFVDGYLELSAESEAIAKAAAEAAVRCMIAAQAASEAAAA